MLLKSLKSLMVETFINYLQVIAVEKWKHYRDNLKIEVNNF